MTLRREGGPPPGWEWASVESLATAAVRAITDGPFGSNLKTEHYSDSGPRVIRLQNIGDGVFRDEYAHISREHFERLKAHEVEAGDVVVALLGDELPRACSIPAGVAPAIVKADCVRIRVDRKRVNPTYLMYALNDPELRRVISPRGVGRPRLRLSDLRQIQIPLAPRAEQDSIVSEIETQFTRLDAGTALFKRVLTQLKTYRASVLKAAIEGNLVLSESVIAERERRPLEDAALLLGSILGHDAPWRLEGAPRPPGWCWARLGGIAALKGGITKGQTRKPADRLRPVPYLRVANVQRGYLDLREVKIIEATDQDIRELALRVGDVLFNEGGDRDKLGRGWIWSGELPECIHQNHVFRARLKIPLDPKFLSWFGNSTGQQYFFAEGKHTTNLASINLTKLSRLPVPIPPPSEQRRIVSEVERRFSFIDRIEKTVTHHMARSAALRSAVLRAAFSGSLASTFATPAA